jgi:hypothetical protein
MELFTSNQLAITGGRHIASEPHMRVQVLTLTTESSKEFFDTYHGELLIIVLEGSLKLTTIDRSEILNRGDQALLIDSEKFNALPADGHSEVKVEYIWAPGNNPCKFFWEVDNKFYGSGAS